VYHTDLPISLPFERIEFARCKATVYHILSQTTAPFLRDDDPLSRYLTKFSNFSPYASKQLARLVVTDRAVRREIRKLRQFRPSVVTVGGDWLDFAFAAGRLDLAVSTLSVLRQECNDLRVPLILASYTGALTMGKDSLAPPPELYDALMLPVNARGFAMFPSPKALLQWASALGKPVLAMHALGVGRIPPATALQYVFTDAGVLGAVVGATSYEHIDELMAAGRMVLGL
jgi:hypothetical protein